MGTISVQRPSGRNHIDCGIGGLSYTTDNLAVQMLMDDLRAAIEKTSVVKVAELLQEFIKKNER